ncbi:hypothetical protein TNCV_4286211 [Trichonephila clavipes]|nr:hypothetical protein TNCV_4286211 [Trichonephila clavipes]
MAMHNATVQPPINTVSPNSNTTNVMFQAGAGSISKHNVVPFHCSCPLFIHHWRHKRLWLPEKALAGGNTVARNVRLRYNANDSHISSPPTHDANFTRGFYASFKPWNMRYREEERERPQIIVEPNMAVMPQFLGQAMVMNGSTESTSTEQFTTITTLFYG